MSEQQTQKNNAQNAPGGEIRFTVYGEPIPKARPRVVSNHAYTPSRTKDHETKIALVYKSLYHSFIFESGVPLRMTVDAYFGIPKSDTNANKEAKRSGKKRPTKKPDADNVAKCVQDACNGVCYQDDSQVVELITRKYYSDEPRTEIHVEKIEKLRSEA